MQSSINVKINGTWKTATNAYAKIKGEWKTINYISPKINGQYKSFSFCEHVWLAPSILTYPTCNNPIVTYKKVCQLCQATTKYYLNANEDESVYDLIQSHSPNLPVYFNDPYNDETHSYTVTCQICNNGTRIIESGDLDHNYDTNHICSDCFHECNHSATITYRQKGYDFSEPCAIYEYDVCKYCNNPMSDMNFSEYEHSGYNEEDLLIEPPTCEGLGHKYYVCKDCGERVIVEYTSEAGHSWTEWSRDEDYQYGHIHTRTCVVCGATETGDCSETETEMVVDKEPTCTEGGYQHSKCSVCGGYGSGFDMDPLPHAYGDSYYYSWENGTHQLVETCTVCGTTNYYGSVESCISYPDNRWKCQICQGSTTG